MVLIGIIIGSSISIGVSYIIIIPNLVEPRFEEISQRLSEVEGSINDLIDEQDSAGFRLSSAEESIKSIEPLSNQVSNIGESISRLDELIQNITNMQETDMEKIDSLISDLKESLTSFNGDIERFRDDISSLEGMLQGDVSILEDNVEKLVSAVDEISSKLEEELAYQLLKQHFVDNYELVAVEIRNELYRELRSSNEDFIQWINLDGSEEVKNVLDEVLYPKFNTLVWYNYYISKDETGKYETYIVTYFSATVDTGWSSIGEIKVPRIRLILMGTVNIAKKRVPSMDLESLDLI